MGSRKNDLGPPRSHFHADDVGADAIILAIMFPRNLFFLRQDRVGLPQVDDHVVLFEALHDPMHQLPFAFLELVIDNIPLGIPYPLDNVLLRCLGRDAPEGARVQFSQKFVAHLSFGIHALMRFAERNLELGVATSFTTCLASKAPLPPAPGYIAPRSSVEHQEFSWLRKPWRFPGR